MSAQIWIKHHFIAVLHTHAAQPGTAIFLPAVAPMAPVHASKTTEGAG